jgi:hypothetical protein
MEAQYVAFEDHSVHSTPNTDNDASSTDPVVKSIGFWGRLRAVLKTA